MAEYNYILNEVESIAEDENSYKIWTNSFNGTDFTFVFYKKKYYGNALLLHDLNHRFLYNRITVYISSV